MHYPCYPLFVETRRTARTTFASLLMYRKSSLMLSPVWNFSLWGEPATQGLPKNTTEFARATKCRLFIQLRHTARNEYQEKRQHSNIIHAVWAALFEFMKTVLCVLMDFMLTVSCFPFTWYREAMEAMMYWNIRYTLL